MGLFGPTKKNRFVEDVPGETAQDRLAHYVQQSGQQSGQPESEPESGRKKGSFLGRANSRQQAPEPVQPAATYAPPAKIEQPKPTAQIHDLELRHPEEDVHHHPRSFIDKLLHVSVYGWIQLALICLLFGAIIDAGQINPFEPGFSWSDALGRAGSAALGIASWAIGSAWKPLLIGVLVVGPIWLIWRLITVPFRH